MTPAAKQRLTPQILEHMRAQVFETLAELQSSRHVMHTELVRNRRVWIDWRFKTQNLIHQYRIERRMLNLVAKGILYEAKRAADEEARRER